jgi:hypothetical protein
VFHRCASRFIGILGCAHPSPAGSPQPVSAEGAPASSAVVSQTLFDVVVSGFQWAGANKTGSLQTAFWTSVYGHSEANCEVVAYPACLTHGIPTAGAYGPLHTVVNAMTRATISERLGRLSFMPVDSGDVPFRCDVLPTIRCHFDEFQALVELTDVDLRGNSATLFMVVAFDASAFGGVGRDNEAFCLRLSQVNGSWSVNGTGIWAGPVMRTDRDSARPLIDQPINARFRQSAPNVCR